METVWKGGKKTKKKKEKSCQEIYTITGPFVALVRVAVVAATAAADSLETNPRAVR